MSEEQRMGIIRLYVHATLATIVATIVFLCFYFTINEVFSFLFYLLTLIVIIIGSITLLLLVFFSILWLYEQ